MKIEIFTGISRHMASPRHGGARIFLNDMSSESPGGGEPIGRRGMNRCQVCGSPDLLNYAWNV
jgi:hypothetical protein